MRPVKVLANCFGSLECRNVWAATACTVARVFFTRWFSSPISRRLGFLSLLPSGHIEDLDTQRREVAAAIVERGKVPFAIDKRAIAMMGREFADIPARRVPVDQARCDT